MTEGRSDENKRRGKTKNELKVKRRTKPFIIEEFNELKNFSLLNGKQFYNKLYQLLKRQ